MSRTRHDPFSRPPGVGEPVGWRAARAPGVAGPRWSRRAFLGGAAATLGLPWIASLPGARAQEAAVPTRVVFWYVPNGMHMPAFRPTTTGVGYTLPAILQPLAPVYDQVITLTGLTNHAATEPRAGDHARGTATFLTCTPVELETVRNGASIDQRIASVLGADTTFPSLQLGCEAGSGAGVCDSGYSCSYSRNVSWMDEVTPLAKQTDPRAVFDRLFSGLDLGATEEDRRRRLARHTSVLDHVAAQADGLRGTLSAADGQRVDSWLTGIRELERRLEQGRGVCEAPDRPDGGLDLDQTARAHADLMVASLACDQTRVISFMAANGGSNLNFPFLGIYESHHQMSHHGGYEPYLQSLTEIGRWEIDILSYFLQGLAAVEEADGRSLLDHTIVVLGSECSDGDLHNHDDLPTLLAGGAAVGLQGGRHLLRQDVPIARLYLDVAHRAGVPLASFGGESARLLYA